MDVTLEEAYAEACRVIGEQIVSQRLLARAEPPRKRQSCAEAHPREDIYHPDGH